MVEAIFSGWKIYRLWPKLTPWPRRHWSNLDFRFGEFYLFSSASISASFFPTPSLPFCACPGAENQSEVVTFWLSARSLLFNPSHFSSIFCFHSTPPTILFIQTGAQMVCDLQTVKQILCLWALFLFSPVSVDGATVVVSLLFDRSNLSNRLYWFTIDCSKIVLFALLGSLWEPKTKAPPLCVYSHRQRWRHFCLGRARRQFLWAASELSTLTNF